MLHVLLKLNGWYKHKVINHIMWGGEGRRNGGKDRGVVGRRDGGEERWGEGGVVKGGGGGGDG